MANPTREQFRHVLAMPVRWGDMDAFGHVNNVTFVQYVESGRVDYLTQVTGHFDPTRDGPIVGEVTCRYLAQVAYPADLAIGTRAVRFSPRTMTLQTGIFVGDAVQPAAVAHVTIVWFDYRTQRSTPIPASLITTVTEFELEPPELTR